MTETEIVQRSIEVMGVRNTALKKNYKDLLEGLGLKQYIRNIETRIKIQDWKGK